MGLMAGPAQMPHDILHHDHGAVNDDAKINGADRQQVGGNVTRVQHNESEQKSQRNRKRNNNRGAPAHQEEDQHQQHQDHAAHKIVFHRSCGDVNQRAAVIKRTYLNIRWQD